MIKENISLVLPTNESCNLCITELNHNIVALQPIITLNNPTIPHTCFQDIINFLLSSNKTYIHKLYFESIKFKYRFISFNLFGHVRAGFKKKLKTQINITDLFSKKESYNWIQPAFLPKFTENIDEIITLTEKRANCLFLATKNGTINNIKYQLINEIIDYNYIYDLHPTDLIPIFDIYITTNILFQHPSYNQNNSYDEKIIINIIKEKYKNLGVNLKII
jgi:hypothetical protein